MILKKFYKLMLMNNVDTSKMLAPASEQDARTWNPKPETLNFEL